MIKTIGHSTHEPDEFVGRCRHGGVRTVVDIRSHPTSKWEWFRREVMDPELNPDSWLAKAGLRYMWLPQLGGWTSRHLSEQIAVQPSTGMPLPQGAPSGAFTMKKVNVKDWATAHGVDVDAYARGYFPKGRIGSEVADRTEGIPHWSNQGLYDYAWYTALPEFRSAAETLIRESQPGYSLQRPALMCAEFLWWKCHRSMVADYLHWRGAKVQHLQPKLTGHGDVIGNRLQRYPIQVRRVWGMES